MLAANGEIYNHRDIRKQFEGSYSFQTQSDCEVILALYKEKGVDFVDDLNGIFGFAIYDVDQDEYFIARDHMGIIPLYIGWDQNGTFYVASELKALEGYCTKIELFPPGLLDALARSHIGCQLLVPHIRHCRFGLYKIRPYRAAAGNKCCQQ